MAFGGRTLPSATPARRANAPKLVARAEELARGSNPGYQVRALDGAA
jgi:hypothetical protein